MISNKSTKIKRIGVITSGGDAPGMNAAIRSVVRVGIDNGLEVFGVYNGYTGLIKGRIKKLSVRDVSGIIQQGGTFLGTARSKNFKNLNVQKQCLKNLEKHNIDGLIIIGGNGSQKGAYGLYKLGFDVVGIASTIDNDLFGPDMSIGVDTALNTIIESIDKIKTTAQSHQRAFLVEVMGRNFGYLALMAGIASGAEIVVTPESEIEPRILAQELHEAHKKGKKYALVIVTDGAKNNAEVIGSYFKQHREQVGYELRITILGHVQRGGSPSVFDRILATRLGKKAVDNILENKTGVLVGLVNEKITNIPLRTVVSKKKTLNEDMLKLADILAK